MADYPLRLATGAGLEGQQAPSTAVIGGMVASTILAVFYVPVFFVLFQWWGQWGRGPQTIDTAAGQITGADCRHGDLPAVAAASEQPAAPAH